MNDRFARVFAVWLLLPGPLLVASGCRKAATTGGPTPSGTGSGTASGAGPRFEDATASAGIRFRHFTGADGRRYMPESVGSGGAFLDYDRDGWYDVFLVNGSNWPGRPAAHQYCALYRNQHDGTFRDVTREAGLQQSIYGQGCAVGDFDNDGWDDILVTCLGRNHLFRNLGAGHFRDITPGSGLDDSPPWAWHTSAAWLDYDRDGLLDLFVGRYVQWSPQTDIACRDGTGKRIYCGPQQYTAEASDLYRNLGHGKFHNVSRETGIASGRGKALGVLPLDEDGDGFVDLLVTNDLVPNHLWRNEGGKRFREVAQEAGVAVSAAGRPRAGMGVDVADIRNDGGISYAIGNFTGEGTALFDRSGLLYADQAAPAGLVPASIPSLTFGVVFLDADRDGWEDLFLYNGHVDQEAQDAAGRPIYRQAPQLFRNEHGIFHDVSAAAGAPFQDLQVGRGCAAGDWNNDGRPDLLLCENGGPTRLLRNSTPDQHHWLGVVLRGITSNRNAYGSEVRLTAAGVTQRRWVHSGGSFLSASDPRALFGLGDAAAVDRLEVRWPSGKTTRIDHPPVARYLEIEEPP